MPKRTDIKKILIVGSGPIIIGQACEFDYSGTQAVKALKEEGYEVVLINSNPASIMTDPEIADKTYIEPITPGIVRKIIEKERPDALLPTMGGQTALNVAMALAENGTLEEFNVELIGAKFEAIKKAEDRKLFKDAMAKIGVGTPASDLAYSVEDAYRIADIIGYPLIIRPAFTLGGTGGGIAYNKEELGRIVSDGVNASPIRQVLVEQSVLGWKEYELEVMKDKNDNVTIICSIENFDAMGVHTGDSITVAPAQTLTDKEYQRLRDYSLAIMREIGVDTGGSNIQFAINPENGDVIVIEMNPRVSRSSALASKATGFPIAKIAAKLAVGYTLDEIPNDITQETPASFEPTLDYVVVKVPRFAFEKFPNADSNLNTMMKSVGEAMAIGRTFKESMNKAMRSLEIGHYGFDEAKDVDIKKLRDKLIYPNASRIFYIKGAFKAGLSIDEIYQLTKIDPWFLNQLWELYEFELELIKENPLSVETLRKAKEYGFSDRFLAELLKITEKEVVKLRLKHKVEPVYKMVDTCGAEFEAKTPYYYSTYDEEDEVIPSTKDKIMVLGGGPNRIGQGIEFDYCCVHASLAIRESGLESIMVNSNPETVSTDYDISDRLYFEPVTFEDVMSIIRKEKPKGVIVQFGGQTPLKLADKLLEAGAPIIGTSPKSIDMAEDRALFGDMLRKLDFLQPENGIAKNDTDAIVIAKRIGYPIVVRPSYVLGGRAMEIVFDETDLKRYMKEAVIASEDKPVLIDKFLQDATEIDVDAVADETDCVIAGIMEHIEQAGIHSGDSACMLPTQNISEKILDRIRYMTVELAKELKVIGLMNIQYAIKGEDVYILEVNPRASRTVPFVSKATGIPWAKIATKVMLGKTLKELDVKEIIPDYISVKEAVLPFSKFTGQDTILGPEMKSTGEVMGIADSFGSAFAKAQVAAGEKFSLSGTAFVSVNDNDKEKVVPIAKKLIKLGFKLYSTKGTAKVLKNNDVEVKEVLKINEGRPNINDLIKNGEIDLIINTPMGKSSHIDDKEIRQAALLYKVFTITTLAAANAMTAAVEQAQKKSYTVQAIQDYYKK
ncbi:MAG: carbamoyl phosphate synthase large subunit [Candidatus Margulisbacteria bacterium GWF2_35_9]|nr:MAG: carbamoyl phosphate synthase large subunit [Candidatus Margulisbacteria bacterium GWF2_35_9]